MPAYYPDEPCSIPGSRTNNVYFLARAAVVLWEARTVPRLSGRENSSNFALIV